MFNFFFSSYIHMWWFFVFIFCLSLSKKHVILFKPLVLIEIFTCHNELSNILPSHKVKKHLCVYLDHIHLWKFDVNKDLNLLILLQQSFCSSYLAASSGQLQMKWRPVSSQETKLLTVVWLCFSELWGLINSALETVHQSNAKSSADHERWQSGKSWSQVAPPPRLTF